MLHNDKSEVLFMLSERVGVHNSNEAEVLAVLEALIVKSDSSNAISWVFKQKADP